MPPPTATRSYISLVSVARAAARSNLPSRIACATDITSQVFPFERAYSPTPPYPVQSSAIHGATSPLGARPPSHSPALAASVPLMKSRRVIGSFMPSRSPDGSCARDSSDASISTLR